jgi:hypothetical protein
VHDHASTLAAVVLLLALVLGLTAPTSAGRVQILLAVILFGVFWVIVDNKTR